MKSGYRQIAPSAGCSKSDPEAGPHGALRFVKIISDLKKSSNASPFNSLAGEIERSRETIVTGLKGSSPAFVSASLFRILGRTVLHVLPTEESARETREALSLFLPPEQVIHFPPWDRFATSVHAPGSDVPSRRVGVLVRLLAAAPVVVVASLEALLCRILPKKVLEGSVEILSIGDRRERDDLAARLLEGGYRRVSLVEREGEFSIRGNLIDFFGTGGENPFRIEFMGDEIESIRKFDPGTQRSRDEVVEISLSPVTEFIRKGESLRRASRNLRIRANEMGLSREERERLAESLEGNRDGFPIPYLLPLFFTPLEDGSEENEGPSPGLDTLFDYLPGRSPVFVDSWPLLRSAGEKLKSDLDRFLFRALEEGRYRPDERSFWMGFAEFEGFLKDRTIVRLSGMDREIDTKGREPVHLPMETTVGLKGPGSLVTGPDGGLLSPLVERIRAWLLEDFQVFYICGEEERERMLHLFSGYGLSAGTSEGPLLFDLRERGLPGRFLVKTGKIREGFIDPGLRVAVVSEGDVFGRKIRRRSGRSRREGFFLKSFGELSLGDFLVHKDHGIGVYKGLERIRIDRRENDFLLIEYQGNDKLFIPVERLDEIQRYIGPDGHRPGLDRLGGPSWDAVKKRVKKSVQAMAEELVQLYATREARDGHRFSPPDRYYEEFESTFEYEETPDQARAIEDVNQDMGDSKPMDRLICGDAGFGKTEVAIRASFRSVMDGKQVAVLVPTTILAEQHYQNFSRRFARYPFRIEVMNRYKPAQEQKKIVEALGKGLVDIVIGTHRLLQKDVVFKDLGLLVIDEEQRFGVADKEKMKRMRSLVDVLTLSATPIPRTLQLSLAGIRDLSVIDTPPLERQAVKIYVADFDEDLIREAIEGEFKRGGQVFFVHDRVRSIYTMAAFVKKILPEARVSVAHGQMKPKELEEEMIRFVKGRTDVLVSTTIIGSGVDIPSANTIIINRADRFGLSQLYQLRGRVGRSREEASAYLLIPRGGTLSREAWKRLQVIQDFSEPGSGFKVALQDLEIRGAGNLLGVSQSGHVSAVGYELYMELLEKAVLELKGEAVPDEAIRPEIHFGLSAFIPDDYIADEQRRLFMYKKISLASSDGDISELREELEDCYGPLPDPAGTLLETIRLRNRLREMRIRKMEYDGRNMVLLFNGDSPVEPRKILDLERKRKKGEFRFTPDLRLFVAMPGLQDREILGHAEGLLHELSR